MREDLRVRLEELVSAHEDEFPQEALRSFWKSLDLPVEESGYLTFEDAFLVQVEADQAEELRFRPGGWVVKASRSAVNGAIVTSLLTIALAASHAAQIPLLVIPGLIRALVDIDKIRLTQSEESILAELTLRQEVREKSVDELYEALPEEIQNQIKPLAFQDFLERCRQAGLADRRKQPLSVVQEPKYLLRAPGSERFRVTFQ